MTHNSKLIIGVSSCLLGEPVRYDGGHKRHALICEELARRFELVGVCPEAEAGLGVPRPPVMLVGDPIHPRALGVEDRGLDVTARLEAFAQDWARRHDDIAGLLLKSRSPSCGISDVPVFDSAGQAQAHGPGIFARVLRQQYPSLPMEDEAGIEDPVRRQQFVERVSAHHRQRVGR